MSTAHQTDLQRGAALQNAGRAAEALPFLRRACAAEKENVEAWCRLAAASEATADFGAAVDAYEAAVRLQPQFAGLRCNCGLAQLRVKNFPAAEAHLRAAIARQADLSAAWNGLGGALKATHRLAEAEECFRQALRLLPTYQEANYNLANLLQTSGRPEQAIPIYESLLRTRPNQPVVLHNLACALSAAGATDQAKAAFEEVLRLAPQHAEAHNQLGNLALARDDWAVAQEAFETALRLRPDLSEAHVNLGNVFLAQNRPEDALRCFERVPEGAEARSTAEFNAGLAHLLLGRFEQGLKGYERRWETEQRAFRREHPGAPLRSPEEATGRTVLVTCEQGIGDTLQFSRYLPLLVQAGAKVIWEVQAPLLELLAGAEGVQVFPRGGTPPRVPDFHVSILSLPLVFGTSLQTIPPPDRGLNVPEGVRSRWRDWLGDRRAPRRVGLIASGNANHKNDLRRSIDLSRLRAALEDLPAEFVLVQKDIRHCDREELSAWPSLRACAAELTNFQETAALVSELDCIVSVDTSVAHLAATLGKPTFVLLPFAPDWRWMLERSDTPWYPSMTLFRQEKPGDWSAPLARIRERFVADTSRPR